MWTHFDPPRDPAEFEAVILRRAAETTFRYVVLTPAAESLIGKAVWCRRLVSVTTIAGGYVPAFCARWPDGKSTCLSGIRSLALPQRNYIHLREIVVLVNCAGLSLRQREAWSPALRRVFTMWIGVK